jgi:hypothetical protein
LGDTVSKLWRGRRQAGLEDQLRALRQEPREQFVEDIVARVTAPKPSRQLRRLGVAVAAAIVVAVPFFAFGGVSVAAQSVQSTVHSLTGSQSSTSGDSHKGGGDGSSAHNEYCPPKEESGRCKPPPPHCDKGQHLGSDGQKCEDDHHGGNGGGGNGGGGNGGGGNGGGGNGGGGNGGGGNGGGGNGGGGNGGGGNGGHDDHSGHGGHGGGGNGR